MLVALCSSSLIYQGRSLDHELGKDSYQQHSIVCFHEHNEFTLLPINRNPKLMR